MSVHACTWRRTTEYSVQYSPSPNKISVVWVHGAGGHIKAFQHHRIIYVHVATCNIKLNWVGMSFKLIIVRTPIWW